jgi:hypothetical protein
MSTASHLETPGRVRDVCPGRRAFRLDFPLLGRSPSQRPDSLVRERARARIRARVSQHIRDIGTLGRMGRRRGSAPTVASR